MVKRFSVVVVLVLALSVISFPTARGVGAPTRVCAEETAHADSASVININTASVDELSTLKGIGEKTAQAIVAYREANGPFAAVEDLMNVKGVGEKKYEAIKDRITVGKAK